MLELIKKRISELKNLEIDTTLVDYLSDFKPNVLFLNENDMYDLLVVFYIVEKDVSLEEAKKEVTSIYDIIEIILNQSDDRKYVGGLLDIFLEIADNNPKFNKTYKEFLKIKAKDNKFIPMIKKMLIKFEKMYEMENINNFLKWVCTKELNDIIILTMNLKGISDELDVVYDMIEDVEMPSFFSERDIKKTQTRFVNKANKSYINKMNKEFSPELNKLSSYQNKKNSEILSIKKKINREIKDLNLLEKDFLNDCLSLEKIEKYKIPDDIRVSAIIELIKNKNIVFNNTFKKQEEYRKNPINQLEIIFERYGYDFNKLTLKERNLLINGIDNDSIEEKLNFLSNSSLKFIDEIDECFINVLMLDVEDLYQLDSLFIRKKIDANFILRYGAYFNSLKVSNVSHNISKLDSKKIDFNKLNEYNSDILFNLNTKLFDLLVKYDINLSDEFIKHYEFLENSKLVNIIDQFIEFGLQEQIKNSPNLIKNGSEKIVKRINLLNQLGESYLTDKLTIEQCARSADKFYISDDYLDDYLNLNYQNYISSDILEILNSSDNLDMLDEIPDSISFIENYKKNDQTYMIGGMYFSRLKFKRCLNTLMEYGYTNYKEILPQILIYNYPKYLEPQIIESLYNMNEEILRKQLI